MYEDYFLRIEVMKSLFPYLDPSVMKFLMFNSSKGLPPAKISFGF